MPVWNDRHIVKRSDRSNLQQFRDATAPFRICLYHRQRTSLQIALDFPTSIEMFAGSNGNGGAPVQSRKALDLFRMGGLFHPMRPVLFHLMRPFQRVIEIPSAKGV